MSIFFTVLVREQAKFIQISIDYVLFQVAFTMLVSDLFINIKNHKDSVVKINNNE